MCRDSGRMEIIMIIEQIISDVWRKAPWSKTSDYGCIITVKDSSSHTFGDFFISLGNESEEILFQKLCDEDLQSLINFNEIVEKLSTEELDFDYYTYYHDHRILSSLDI